ncbi:MAG: AAA family ATPase, partial [Succinivibrionaceae bacterium]
MGSILNPSNEDFLEYIKSKEIIYVDKTDFISEINKYVKTPQKYICFTRPRRFGKTVTAKMLSAYYSKGCDSKELFANLKIAQDPSFLTHLNKYNVIYIDMNKIKSDFSFIEKSEKIQDIVDYLLYTTVLELKEKEAFAKIIENNPLISSKSLPKAVYDISLKLNEKFIFIMDEWDLIYREYKNDT